MRVSVLAGCALLVAACPAFSATIHVSPDASGDYPTIQAAIDAASSGDEILLADGTFTGDGNWDVDFGTKELVLTSENGYEATTIDCGFDGFHDIFHRGVIIEGGQTSATQIEGITFQHTAGPMDGGSIRCVGASPVLRRVRIRENRTWGRGAGVFVQSGSPTMEDCVFLGYFSNGEGTAIFAEQSWVSVQRCFFDINGWGVADVDGGTFTDCLFDGVRGQDENQGSGIWSRRGQVTILRCTFRNTFGVAVDVTAPGEAVIGNCLFEDNVGDSGAGISASGNATIRNTTFRGNYSPFGGAAVQCSGLSDVAVTLDHCIFVDNRAGGPGAVGSAIEGWGPGLDLEVTQSTFVGNRNLASTQWGAAIGIQNAAHLTIDHTIIAFGGQASLPDGAVHCDGPAGGLVVTCSDFYGNEGGDWTGCVAGMDAMNGNLSDDPLFCDVAAGDLSLHGDSPCAPSNSGECGLIGALGPWCGPLAVEPHSWGSIKALYR